MISRASLSPLSRAASLVRGPSSISCGPGHGVTVRVDEQEVGHGVFPFVFPSCRTVMDPSWPRSRCRNQIRLLTIEPLAATGLAGPGPAQYEWSPKAYTRTMAMTDSAATARAISCICSSTGDPACTTVAPHDQVLHATLHCFRVRYGKPEGIRQPIDRIEREA